MKKDALLARKVALEAMIKEADQSGALERSKRLKAELKRINGKLSK